MIREEYQESLLPNTSRPTRSLGNGSWRWRNNLLLLVMIFSIVACLSVYFYLNMEAIDGNHLDPTSYKPLSRRKPMLDHESIFSDSGPSMIKLSDLLANCIVALRIAGREVVNLSLAHNDKLKHVGSKGKTLEGVNDIVTSVDLKSHQMIVNTIKDSYRRLNVVSEEDSTKSFEDKSVEDDLLPINRSEFASMLSSDLHEIENDHIRRSNPLLTQHETLVWIDPLDATKEYSENLTDFVTLMACVVHKSVPIAGVIFKPFTNQTFWSMVDTSTGKSHQSPDLKEALSETSKTDDINIIVSRSHAGDVKNLIGKIYGHGVNIISAGGSGYKTIELIKSKADAYVHLTHIKKWDICAPYVILRSISGGNMTDLSGNEISFGDAKDKVVSKGLVATRNRKLHKELVDAIVHQVDATL